MRSLATDERGDLGGLPSRVSFERGHEVNLASRLARPMEDVVGT